MVVTKYFNTTGPCEEHLHFMVPPEPRLPHARGLIERGLYFVVHAPRQTGKTTALKALARHLTAEGKFAALYITCEMGAVFSEQVEPIERLILDQIRSYSRNLPQECRPESPWPEAAPGRMIHEGLVHWASKCPRPVVLLLDEIDSLSKEALITVLRQLRAGFPERPFQFPHSVVLCGMKDVRDYKMASGGDPDRLGTSSPFNIKDESFRISDFTHEQVAMLINQYVQESGQPFTPQAIEKVWYYTQGQPWLVNALAREVTEKMGLSISTTIEEEHIDTAKEKLIIARQTHIDSLVHRLHETRVRRVIQPLLEGELPPQDNAFDDDLQYCRDLGLIALDAPVRVACPLYQEVIVRALAYVTQESIPLERQSYLTPDGKLDIRCILEEFGQFWQEHGEVILGQMAYHEVAPHLVLMAYFQRVINGGGRVQREYGVGRKRIDLLEQWPFGSPKQWQKEAIELKVWRPKQKDPLAEGLLKLSLYINNLGLDHGTLVLFDRRPEARDWEERVSFEEHTTADGKPVLVMRALPEERGRGIRDF